MMQCAVGSAPPATAAAAAVTAADIGPACVTATALAVLIRLFATVPARVQSRCKRKLPTAQR